MSKYRVICYFSGYSLCYLSGYSEGYRAICHYSGYSEGYGDTEEEAIENAKYKIPQDANADSFETFCEDSEEEEYHE